jgi:hypothetical protein
MDRLSSLIWLAPRVTVQLVSEISPDTIRMDRLSSLRWLAPRVPVQLVSEIYLTQLAWTD